MKNTLSWLWILLAFICLVSCNSSQDNDQKKKHYLTFSTSEELEQYLQWTSGKTPILAAHRGGPMNNYPENCLETFENILTYAPCIIECDVSKTKDGKLVLFHDDELSRTSTGKGNIGNFTLDELQSLYLRDNQGIITSYKIPTLSQALEWAKNKAILEIDVKKGIKPEEIVSMVEAHKAQAYTIIITYEFKSVEYYHKLNPNLMISAPAKGIEGTKQLLAMSINHKKILGFVGVYEPPEAVYHLLHEKKICAILGTLGNLDKKAQPKGTKLYIEFLKNGADILATDNVPLATQTIQEYSQKRN